MGFYVIEGEKLERYLGVLKNILKNAKVSMRYPNLKKFLKSCELWNPDLQSAVNSKLPIDDKSNLPAEEAFTRLINETKIYLSEKNAEMNKSNPYYLALMKQDFLMKYDVSVSYLNAPEFYSLVIDRYDLSESLPVRYTIKFENGGKPLFTSVSSFEEMCDNVNRAVRDEAIFALLLLMKNTGKFKVFSVSRGRAGPLWFSGACPKILQPLFDEYPDHFVFNLPLDIAGNEVSHHLNRDPFESMFEKSLSNGDIVKKTFEDENFRVYKERRMIVAGDHSSEFASILEKTFPFLIISSV